MSRNVGGELLFGADPSPTLPRSLRRAAYTLQTELAQIVQQSQGYRKPYFLFYLTHS